MIFELPLGSFSPCLEEYCKLTTKQLYGLVLQDLSSTAFLLMILLSLPPLVQTGSVLAGITTSHYWALLK